MNKNDAVRPINRQQAAAAAAINTGYGQRRIIRRRIIGFLFFVLAPAEIKVSFC